MILTDKMRTKIREATAARAADLFTRMPSAAELTFRMPIVSTDPALIASQERAHRDFARWLEKQGPEQVLDASHGRLASALGLDPVALVSKGGR